MDKLIEKKTNINDKWDWNFTHVSLYLLLTYKWFIYKDYKDFLKKNHEYLLFRTEKRTNKHRTLEKIQYIKGRVTHPPEITRRLLNLSASK